MVLRSNTFLVFLQKTLQHSHSRMIILNIFLFLCISLNKSNQKYWRTYSKNVSILICIPLANKAIYVFTFVSLFLSCLTSKETSDWLLVHFIFSNKQSFFNYLSYRGTSIGFKVAEHLTVETKNKIRIRSCCAFQSNKPPI